jgi:hypothetical protein
MTYNYGKNLSDKMAIDFFLRTWHSYTSDKATVDQICRLVNLSILKHNEHNQVKVIEHNARLFLNPRIEIWS